MLLVIAVSILFCIAVSLALVVRCHFRGRGVGLPVTVEWIEELTPERYRPMLRLLSSEDILFLRSQPACTPTMLARFRRQRCEVFRRYLRLLEGDFRRVAMALRFLMVQSGRDRPDLASALILSQFRFAASMFKIETRVLLYRWGLGDVDISGLLAIFDSMRIELRTLVPVAVASPA